MENDMPLGDVVISKPDDCFGGVVRWNRGKRTPEGKFKRTGSLDKPPTVLLNALSAFETEINYKQFKFDELLREALQRSPDVGKDLNRPDEKDDLYRADYARDHDGDSKDCKSCDRNQIIPRSQRLAAKTHYGTIASGNSGIKSAPDRDKVCKDLGGIKCFEMEAARLMGRFPCLVIRGICDYSDSHKNDKWQSYASITAAMAGRHLLKIMPWRDVERTEAAYEIQSSNGQTQRDTGPPLTQQAMSRTDPHLFASRYPSSHQNTPLAVSSPPNFANPAEQQRSLLSD